MSNKRVRRADRKDWIWPFIYGLAVIAIGVLALLNPFAASLSVGIMLAIGLLAYGGLMIAAGFLSGKTDWPQLLLGILTLVAGAVTVAMPLTGAVTIVWMTGAWLLVTGLMSVVFGLRRERRGWILLAGLLDIILGTFLLFADPASALFYVGVMFGVSLAVRGTFLVIAAFNLRARRGQ